MDDVTEMCADFMTSKLDKNNCLLFFEAADLNNLDEIRSKCVNFVKSITLSSIERNPVFASMNLETKYAILAERIKSLEAILNKFSNDCNKLILITRFAPDVVHDLQILQLEQHTKKCNEMMQKCCVGALRVKNNNKIIDKK